MARTLWATCLGVVLTTSFVAGGRPRADEPPVVGQGAGGRGGKKPAGNAALDPALDPATRRAAAQRGLDWLERHALGVPETQGTPTRPFLLAVTGLDVLLDAGGYAPKGARARLLAAVRKDLSGWLDGVEERLTDPRNLPTAHGQVDSSKLVQYVWPAALTGWLAAECLERDLVAGVGDASSARRDLARVERLLAGAQQPDGGWGHGRIAGEAPPAAAGAMGLTLGYPATLLAPTSCAATAVGLLDRAHKRPASPVATRAIEHYRKAVLANGNFPYDLRQRSADRDLTGVGRTAGALVALHALGVPASDALAKRAGGFLREHWDVAGEGHGSPVLNLVFAALAARLLGPSEVEAFERLWIPRVLATQSEEGAFDCACTKALFGSSCDGVKERAGLQAFEATQRAYVTSLTTFVLLLDHARPRLLEPGPKAPARDVTPR